MSLQLFVVLHSHSGNPNSVQGVPCVCRPGWLWFLCSTILPSCPDSSAKFPSAQAESGRQWNTGNPNQQNPVYENMGCPVCPTYVRSIMQHERRTKARYAMQAVRRPSSSLLSEQGAELLALKHESRILGYDPRTPKRMCQNSTLYLVQGRAKPVLHGPNSRVKPVPSWRNHIQGCMNVWESYSRALDQGTRTWMIIFQMTIMMCISQLHWLLSSSSRSFSLSRRGRVDLDEDGGDGGVAPLLGQPLRLVQLEVRVRRRRCRGGGGAICEKRARHWRVRHWAYIVIVQISQFVKAGVTR